MSRLSERVRNLESRLDDRNRIQFLEAKTNRLEEKVEALTRHFGIKFEMASVVAVTGRKNEQ